MSDEQRDHNANRDREDPRPSSRRGSVRLTAIITALIAIGLYALIILQHL